MTPVSAELKIYEWLDKRRIPFSHGTMADFLLLDYQPPIYLRVLSEGQSGGHATIAREQLERMGYIVVDVYEQQIEENIDRVMRAAIVGEEIHG